MATENQNWWQRYISGPVSDYAQTFGDYWRTPAKSVGQTVRWASEDVRGAVSKLPEPAQDYLRFVGRQMTPAAIMAPITPATPSEMQRGIKGVFGQTSDAGKGFREVAASYISGADAQKKPNTESGGEWKYGYDENGVAIMPPGFLDTQQRQPQFQPMPVRQMSEAERNYQQHRQNLIRQSETRALAREQSGGTIQAQERAKVARESREDRKQQFGEEMEMRALAIRAQAMTAAQREGRLAEINNNQFVKQAEAAANNNPKFATMYNALGQLDPEIARMYAHSFAEMAFAADKSGVSADEFLETFMGKWKTPQEYAAFIRDTRQTGA